MRISHMRILLIVIVAIFSFALLTLGYRGQAQLLPPVIISPGQVATLHWYAANVTTQFPLSAGFPTGLVFDGESLWVADVGCNAIRTYTVPFRAERGYLLLQTTVNDKPSVLILDTGSPVSFSSGHVLQFRAKDGAVSFRFDDRKPLNAQYYAPERIAYDGILGNDLLSEFSAVRIDYKEQKVELQAEVWPG